MHETLVLIHVLSAIIGVGPTYFNMFLLRPGVTGGELQHNLKLAEKLTIFPKVGGTLAVVSGLALTLGGQYGPFTQVWMLGSLLLYVAIQVVVIGFVAPREQQLAATFASSVTPVGGGTLTLTSSGSAPRQDALLRQINALHLVTLLLGTTLFALMILKPR